MTTSRCPTLKVIQKIRHKRSCILPVSTDPFRWNGVPVEFRPASSTTPYLVQEADNGHETSVTKPSKQSRQLRSRASHRNLGGEAHRELDSSHWQSARGPSPPQDTHEFAHERAKRQSVILASALPPDYFERPPLYDDFIKERSERQPQPTLFRPSDSRHHIAEPAISPALPVDWNAYLRAIPLERPDFSPLSASLQVSASTRITHPFEIFDLMDSGTEVTTSATLQPPTPISPLNELDRQYIVTAQIDDLLRL